MEKLQREQNDIKEKIELAKNKIEDYNRRIDKLEDDFQREKIARDKLQMVKEKEEIYRFINN
ncbi:MAG: septum formation initiator family protein [Fusobacterium mortiferum]|mgnify:FL=1|nr:septum formation initiator family protein [Fusobacterium mortiferum]MCI7186781.1 septum formation initiator family protein [Fusobacterium mortiferum]MCI7664545.1 septum formation initiator family protein [Fusobacterium mortiferum]